MVSDKWAEKKRHQAEKLREALCKKISTVRKICDEIESGMQPRQTLVATTPCQDATTRAEAFAIVLGDTIELARKATEMMDDARLAYEAWLMVVTATCYV